MTSLFVVFLEVDVVGRARVKQEVILYHQQSLLVGFCQTHSFNNYLLNKQLTGHWHHPQAAAYSMEETKKLVFFETLDTYSK